MLNYQVHLMNVKKEKYRHYILSELRKVVIINRHVIKNIVQYQIAAV